MNKLLTKMRDHFEGDSTRAYLALALLAAGILIFIINNAIGFFSDTEAYFWPRTIMKGLTDACWIVAAVMGTRFYPTRRNELLIPTLVFYALGDIAVMFSVPVGGILYGIGHVFMIWAILETTYIRRWQRILLLVMLVIGAVLLFMMVDELPLIIIGFIYGAIVTSVMCFSLSNRFFWLAGAVFYISDITGLLRLQLWDNNISYLITTTIYFAAYFMLCISVFSTNRKEVVTVNDLFSMLKDSRARKVPFWVCGKWALGLVKGDRHYSYDHIDLAYDIDHVDEFMAWMKRARYERKHKYANGIRIFYSERYGELRIFPCLFREDGSASLTMENGHQLELDPGFFENVKAWGRTIPCIAPGGQELMKAAMYNPNEPSKQKKRIDIKEKIDQI